MAVNFYSIAINTTFKSSVISATFKSALISFAQLGQPCILIGQRRSKARTRTSPRQQGSSFFRFHSSICARQKLLTNQNVAQEPEIWRQELRGSRVHLHGFHRLPVPHTCDACVGLGQHSRSAAGCQHYRLLDQQWAPIWVAVAVKRARLSFSKFT